MHDLLGTLAPVTMAAELKILGIAVAVGLDVLALSIAIGIMRTGLGNRLKLAIAFSTSEVLMQLVGYAIGSGVGHIIGTVADYVGFAVVAAVGIFIVRESFQAGESVMNTDSPLGLIATCASVSLDSLGIGVSLPGVPLPLIPLLVTVAISTVLFTSAGLAFGSLLGERYEQLAERGAGVVLILLALVFTIQHLAGSPQ
jgi:putative Mn2+ efflux pump MntP